MRREAAERQPRQVFEHRRVSSRPRSPAGPARRCSGRRRLCRRQLADASQRTGRGPSLEALAGPSAGRHRSRWQPWHTPRVRNRRAIDGRPLARPRHPSAGNASHRRRGGRSPRSPPARRRIERRCPAPRTDRTCARHWRQGVESVTSAVVTMPTLKPRPRVRVSSSPMYSIRGLSNASAVLSGNTPDWLLLFFCPVEYAAIPGDESVMAELSDGVMTSPVTSSVSMAR